MELINLRQMFDSLSDEEKYLFGIWSREFLQGIAQELANNNNFSNRQEQQDDTNIEKTES
jgi:hypothetical protein